MPCKNMPSNAGAACICLTRKCADGRSWLRMCSAASSVGCSWREAIWEVRLAWRGLFGGRRGAGECWRWAWIVWNVRGVLMVWDILARWRRERMEDLGMDSRRENERWGKCRQP